MDQNPQDSAPLEGGSEGTTRRKLLGTALAGTAVGALGAQLPLAGAHSQGRQNRSYSLPKGKYRIDLHTHYIPPEYAAFLASKKVVSVPWSVDAQLEFMDKWNIQKSVVSAPQPFDYGDVKETQAVARGINDYGAKLKKDHGDRYEMHATLPLPYIKESLAELSYCFDTLKFKGGVMLFANYNGVYIGDPYYEELYAELDKRKMTVWLHPAFPAEEPIGPFVGGQVVEYPFETTRAAVLLMYNGVMRKYPNIKWQLSHAGGTLPHILTRLAFGQWIEFYFKLKPLPEGPFNEAKKFYYDTALGQSDEQLLSVGHLVDESHIIFGTDWPFTAWMYSDERYKIAPWWEDDLPTKKGDPAPVLSRLFSKPEREKIERKNAKALYPGLI